MKNQYQTKHKIIFGNSKEEIKKLPDNSINLIVTSPPYPMIEMWDEIFNKQDSEIGKYLENNQANIAFEKMHNILDEIWNEIYRIILPGGFVCINIGDATRTFEDNFQLFNNHSRILNHCLNIGFQSLPDIIWRKQTNAPNKFMGSGMLPPAAYVTLEHEYILVLRKHGKRKVKDIHEKKLRQESAYFWEERNIWFSDIWFDIKGIGQKSKDKNLRNRSGAFPFELAYRLINMFSIKNDIVIDPFLGTGTTTLAAMASERNSVGFEIDNSFKNNIFDSLIEKKDFINDYINNRLVKHIDFTKERIEKNYKFKNQNEHYGFPCISKQESNILIRNIENIRLVDDGKSLVISY